MFVGAYREPEQPLHMSGSPADMEEMRGWSPRFTTLCKKLMDYQPDGYLYVPKQVDEAYTPENNYKQSMKNFHSPWSPARGYFTHMFPSNSAWIDMCEGQESYKQLTWLFLWLSAAYNIVQDGYEHYSTVMQLGSNYQPLERWIALPFATRDELWSWTVSRDRVISLLKQGKFDGMKTLIDNELNTDHPMNERTVPFPNFPFMAPEDFRGYEKQNTGFVTQYIAMLPSPSDSTEMKQALATVATVHNKKTASAGKKTTLGRDPFLTVVDLTRMEIDVDDDDAIDVDNVDHTPLDSHFAPPKHSAS